MFLLTRTTFGRAVYGIGNRERAAYLSGVNTRRVVMIAFAISGGLAAFGGVLLAGYASKAAQSMGDAYLLPSIAAVVLGGTNILGGRGTYLGTVAGVILITLLQSILSVMQMPEAGPPGDLRRRDHRDAAALRTREAVALAVGATGAHRATECRSALPADCPLPRVPGAPPHHRPHRREAHAALLLADEGEEPGECDEHDAGDRRRIGELVEEEQTPSMIAQTIWLYCAGATRFAGASAPPPS